MTEERTEGQTERGKEAFLRSKIKNVTEVDYLKQK